MDLSKSPGNINTRTQVVNIGGVLLGGNNPVRIQSMTNVDTLNTRAVVRQVVDLYKAGSEYVRISVPGIKHAENLKEISKLLKREKCPVPLIADVHFNDKIAKLSARYVSKIRINPGNLYEQGIQYSPDISENDYKNILEKIELRFFELLEICRHYGTVIRIGTNHGSLSARITLKYGNTVDGMVESALEYVRMCENKGFRDIVLSMKASNISVMINANRRLIEKMASEEMNYPLHLGVTEAGNELEGRMKSAAGIGTLLIGGIGDTIRVSLTEDPIKELPVAKVLARRFSKSASNKFRSTIDAFHDNIQYNPDKFHKFPILGQRPLIINYQNADIQSSDFLPDLLFTNIHSNNKLINTDNTASYNVLNLAENLSEVKEKDLFFARLAYSKDHQKGFIEKLSNDKRKKLIILESHYSSPITQIKDYIQFLRTSNIEDPIILKRDYGSISYNDIILYAGSEISGLILQDIIDGLWLCGKNLKAEKPVKISRVLLQVCGKRIFEAEYISCPSCARTLFDIEKTLAEIKKCTSQMKGLKIAVMGCIVNGPGEMADADFGYVGAGPGKINLYMGSKLLLKNVDEKMAVESLVRLICANF